MSGVERDAGAMARHAYIRRESMLSIAINAVLSLAFFIAAFGLDPAVPVPVAGAGGYALDILPQSFMIALMSTLVPGALTAMRIRKRRIAGVPETGKALLLRALVTALAALAVGAGIALALHVVAGDVRLSWIPALIAKIVYGAALAAAVTPVGLRVALRHAAAS